MAKVLLKQVTEHIALYRCSRTGIAWVEDGTTGSGHSAHANIDATGSVRGMKSRGYWRKDDRTVRTHGAIYNIDSAVVTDELDQLATDWCQCGGKHNRSNQ